MSSGTEEEPPADLLLKLRAAADRLIAGTPLHSSGKLTILDLAREAQVKRWLLTHKYPITVMAKFQAEFKAAEHKSEPIQAADRKIAKLQEDLAEVRKENGRLADVVHTYAIMIEQLATDLAAVTGQRDAAIAARDATLANVTPLSRAPSLRFTDDQ
ncbi:hypothetical protein [Kitasatospora sp. NPDC002040]|uniref:hypothetical protein n=1 Tax=Kitasatospora sp. NPDC002040 TaxID=3154661 RepID=UPI00331A67E7